MCACGFLAKDERVNLEIVLFGKRRGAKQSVPVGRPLGEKMFATRKGNLPVLPCSMHVCALLFNILLVFVELVALNGQRR